MTIDLHRELDRVRAEIPITQTWRFFNTGWAGPECRAGMAAQTDMIAWLNATGIGHHSMPQVRELTERVRGKVAAYVHASPDTIVLTRGVVDGMNVVLHGYDWRAGDQIITTDLEHSGGLVPLYVLRDRHDLEVTIVPIQTAADAPACIAAACTPRTRLVMFSHVSYNTGLQLPGAAIVGAVHARGARVLVDGAQSVGAIPVDAPALGADYYAFPGHKWLLGPECTGALYLAPEAAAALQLSFTGYDTVRTYDAAGHYTVHAGPRRFEGIDHNPVALAGWEAALDFMTAIGEAAIAERIAHLVARLQDGLAGGAGYRVRTPRGSVTTAGLVGLALDTAARTGAVVEALHAQGYLVRHTPQPPLLRISVNFFNTEAEVDGLASAVRAATG